MTIRRTINMAEVSRVYGQFRDGLDIADRKQFAAARRLFNAVDLTVNQMENEAKMAGLALDKTDMIFETESMIFDLFRRSNPGLSDEIGRVVEIGERGEA